MPVTVISTPPGALACVDSGDCFPTPHTFMLEVGKHRARVTLEGHLAAERDFPVEELMEAPVHFRLRPAGEAAP